MGTAAIRGPCGRRPRWHSTRRRAEGDKDGQTQARASARRRRGEGGGQEPAHLAAEAQLAGADDPRQASGHGAGGSGVLQETHRQGREEVRDVGGSQRREQSRARCQRSGGQGSLRGQEPGAHPLPCARPGSDEPDREAVRAAHRRGEGARGRNASRRRRIMGHKVNPIGLRVGINRTWDSRWFASRGEYGRLLHEDMHIRDHILKQQRQAGISRVVIERPHKKCRVTVHTARPGVLNGKKGADIEKLRGELAKLTSSEVHLNIVEVRKPEIDATLVAETIAQQLERRVAFRRAMKRAVQSAIRLGALGIRINCSGRLGGAEIARVEWYREGRVPLHTLRADIDFGYGLAKTAYGVIGVKVWIFKGEIMEHDPMAAEKRAVEAQEGGGGGRRRSGGGGDRDGGWAGGERQAEPAKA